MATPASSHLPYRVNNVLIYNLSTPSISKTEDSSSSLRQNRRRRGKNDGIALLQDFDFNAASQTLTRVTHSITDVTHFVATGTYPPRLKIFDCADASMKLERGLTSQVTSVCVLSNDWTKLALLQRNRSVAIHAAYGAHDSIRLPTAGRDMLYDATSCDLIVASVGTQGLYRLNLDTGMFRTPLDIPDEANVVACNPMYSRLCATGGDAGLITCLDLNTTHSVGTLDVKNSVTAVAFDPSGLLMGVGTESGVVTLFDIRSSKPLTTLTHHYDQPITKVVFSHDKVFSLSSKAIKLFNTTDGSHVTTLESSSGLNDMDVQEGLITAACDATAMQAWFVPSLGKAPRWCRFLEHVTEELAGDVYDGTAAGSATAATFDSFQFITTEECAHLGMTHMTHTSLLKPHLHGYFIDRRLYTKLSALTPDKPSYAEWRKATIRAKLAATSASRITAAAPKAKKVIASAAEQDPRFAQLQSDDFALDTNSETFARLHPAIQQSVVNTLERKEQAAEDTRKLVALESESDTEQDQHIAPLAHRILSETKTDARSKSVITTQGISGREMTFVPKSATNANTKPLTLAAPATTRLRKRSVKELKLNAPWDGKTLRDKYQK